jgi:predicted LPLAT superfamily acyltransferase
MGEAGFAGGIRFLFWVHRHLGAWPFRFLLFFVILWFFSVRRTARRASLEYLQRLHETSGGKTPPANHRNSFRHFLTFAETVLEKLLAYDARLDSLPYHTEGAEPLLRLIAEKRGALIITAHLGNLELCRRLTQNRAHMKLTVLVHTHHAERFNRILHALNPKQEIDLVQVGRMDFKTAMLLSERIEAGNLVVIAGDRIPVKNENATLTLPFLGKKARFPSGPYILAAALTCPVFTLFSARRDQQFVITLRPLAQERIILPRKNRDQAIRPYLQAYVAALTEECQKNPLQWFNFFPFWDSGDNGRDDDNAIDEIAKT